MALNELARIAHAVNAVMEQSSSAIGLSKRAAVALAMMAMQADAMTNAKLQAEFVKWNISTVASAKKDGSAAKSELLEKRYIEIGIKVSQFTLSETGRDAVEKLYAALKKSTERLGLSERERALVLNLVEMSRPAKPVSRASGSPSLSKFNKGA